MPVELLFRNGRRICLSKQPVSLGRADLPSCAEAIFVSRLCVSPLSRMMQRWSGLAPDVDSQCVY
jgi:hypothetical protein